MWKLILTLSTKYKKKTAVKFNYKDLISDSNIYKSYFIKDRLIMNYQNQKDIPTKGIKIKVFLTIYLVMFISLVISEYLNAFYNQKYDMLGINALGRIPFAFKPMVMGLYVVFSTITYLKVIHYLKPLFIYYDKGTNYNLARKAAIKIPWFILYFQVIIWTFGTTVYYAIKGWNADSGIPFFFGLSIKIASGIISSMYAALIINIVLQDLKQKLNITTINKGEKDIFSRYRDYFVYISSVFFILVYYLYISYYFSISTIVLSQGKFLALVIPVGFFLFIIGIIPIVLAKKEYYFQINILKNEMQNLSESKASLSDEINLINFDELGEMAVYVNQILKRFRTLFEKIASTVDSLSEASGALTAAANQNSCTLNQQAAATTEVVSTMEDSNGLSKTIGSRAEEVSEKSEIMTKYVAEGNKTIEDNLKTNESVKSANQKTIDFIESLNVDIESIKDVVHLINGIADQIKIIAFNAELEASSAGEAGKNFEIVATEIRRLADSTVASTSEIQGKISIIEKAGNQLIDASRASTKLIQSSWNISKDAKDIFKKIEKSSADSSNSSKMIRENIKMQIDSFEQILITVRQIAQGVNDSVQSTSMVAKTAEKLEKLVESLKELTGK